MNSHIVFYLIFLLSMYTQGRDILEIWLHPNIILHTSFKGFWLVCVFQASFMVGLTLINLWLFYICTPPYCMYTCTLLYFIVHMHSEDELNFDECTYESFSLFLSFKDVFIYIYIAYFYHLKDVYLPDHLKLE